jgi:regulator of nucleoside diphosphate kinase
MGKTKNELVLRRDDYNVLISYLHGAKPKTAFDRVNADALHAELRKAKLVDESGFPDDVVRINSTVHVKTGNKNNVMQVTLVTPDKANIKENKISVMAPLGTALLGFRKGQRVKWRVPAGEKTFEIVDVINED